jgi:hypothetical protein
VISGTVSGTRNVEVFPVMWWNHGAWGASEWSAMIMIVVAFWGLLIASVAWLVQSFGNEPTRAESAHRPTALAERFAGLPERLDAPADPGDQRLADLEREVADLRRTRYPATASR